MKESSHSLIGDQAKLSAPVLDPGEDHSHKQQKGNRRLIDEQRHENVDGHLLLKWTALAPGDVVTLQVTTGVFTGAVESKACDGLIVWMRDDLNERRLFHFHDCQSLWLMKSSSTESWKHWLEELRKNCSEEQDAQRSDVATAFHIRMTQLAEQLEREIEYRSGDTHTRRGFGKRLLESELQSNDGGRMTFLVLKEASRLVRENAQAWSTSSWL